MCLKTRNLYTLRGLSIYLLIYVVKKDQNLPSFMGAPRVFMFE